MNILWQPQPKQRVFMERPEFEVLYGGAAGGGKSDALVMEALRQVHIPHYKALILRKTYPELSELIEKSLLVYARAVPGAKYNSTQHTWTFPSGAKIVFGSLQHRQDRTKYQGKSFDLICFDELTHFEYDEYIYLFSRARPNGPGTRVYVRATTNPGGIGHGWVKERFISAAPPMTTVWEDMEVTDPDGKKITIKRDRVFVPATVFDNKKLLENDPTYIGSLAMLPESERKALLLGSWDSFSGQVFLEWRNDPKHYHDRLWTHVVEPFSIPVTWPIVRSMDWGYSKPFSVGWQSIGPGGKMYRIRELYGCTGEPNRGVMWTPGKVAKEIYRIEHEDPNLKGHTIIGIADPAIFESNGGISIADAMSDPREVGAEAVYFSKGDNKRIPGKMQCHYRLAFDETGNPMFQVFHTCKHFIRCIPALVYDETDVEDVDTAQEDHNYDEWRYCCMENPIGPRENYKKEDWSPPPEDPLNLREDLSVRRDPFEIVKI